MTIDPYRRTGRTAKLMLEAPHGSVFISCAAGALSYDWGLAQKHGRTDLKIVAPTWLTGRRWQGMTLTGIVLDHDARLTEQEQYALTCALTRVRTP